MRSELRYSRSEDAFGKRQNFCGLGSGCKRENIYVQSVKLNGRPYDKSYITHEQIMNGDTLEFEMGNRPGPV